MPRVADASALLDELLRARWFGGKSRGPRSAHVVDRVAWTSSSILSLIEVDYDHGPPDLYALAERFEDPSLARALLEQFHGSRARTEAGGSLVFEPTHVFDSIDFQRIEPIRPLRGEQSNSSLLYGDALILKLFRRVQFGPQPDTEIGWFLTEHSQFSGTPAVVGSASYTAPDGRTAAVALLQRFEPNRGDAWRTTLERLDSVLAGSALDDSVRPFTVLGRTTAELHIALANAHAAPDFAPSPIDASDIEAWRVAIRDEVLHATDALRRRQIAVDPEPMLHRADGIAALIGSHKIRHHGDYHLGQVLEREDGSFVIIDFEGEPSKPLAQRREKRSPLRDVAGMLRSFDYARNAALRAGDLADPLRVARAAEWYSAVREAFLASYLTAVRASAPTLLPPEVDAPLSALELEKAAYEVLYELNNRPDWLPIPLAALAT
jgi:trehalose synthase-fused probable maltokinase